MSCLFCGLLLAPHRLRSGPCGAGYCCGRCEKQHKDLFRTVKSSAAGIRDNEKKIVDDAATGLEYVEDLVKHLAMPARPGDPPNEVIFKKTVADRLVTVLRLLEIGKGGFEQADSVLQLAAETLRSIATVAAQNPETRSKADLPNTLAESIELLLNARRGAKRAAAAPEQEAAARRPAPPPAAAPPAAAPQSVFSVPVQEPPAGVVPEFTAEQRFLAELEAAASRPPPLNAKLASIEKDRRKDNEQLNRIAASMPTTIHRNLFDAARNIAVAFASAEDNSEDKTAKGQKVDKEVAQAGKALSSVLVELSDSYGERLSPELWRQIMGMFEYGVPAPSGAGKIAIPGPNRVSLEPLESATADNVTEVLLHYLPIGFKLIEAYYGHLTLQNWQRLVVYVRDTPRAQRNDKWLAPIYKGILPGARGWIAPTINKLRRIRGSGVLILVDKGPQVKALFDSLRAQQQLYW